MVYGFITGLSFMFYAYRFCRKNKQRREQYREAPSVGDADGTRGARAGGSVGCSDSILTTGVTFSGDALRAASKLALSARTAPQPPKNING